MLCTTSRRVYGAEHPKVAHSRATWTTLKQAALPRPWRAAAAAAAAASSPASPRPTRPAVVVFASVLHACYMSLLDNRVLTRYVLAQSASQLRSSAADDVRKTISLIGFAVRYKARLQPLHASRQD